MTCGAGNDHYFQGDKSFLWFDACSDDKFISTQAKVKDYIKVYQVFAITLHDSFS